MVICGTHFCSVFYDGTLQNAVSEEERKMKGLESLWPTDKPVFFWCHSGQEEISSSGTSYLNRLVDRIQCVYVYGFGIFHTVVCIYTFTLIKST